MGLRLASLLSLAHARGTAAAWAMRASSSFACPMCSLAHPANSLGPQPKGFKVKGVKGCRSAQVVKRLGPELQTNPEPYTLSPKP